MKTFEKSTGTVNVLAEYLDAGFSKKSYPAWIRHHFPDKEPHLASIKTTFFVSPREMIRAIQNSQKYKTNAVKRDTWLSQAYIDLDMQYKLNFDSVLNTTIFKMCFNIMRNMEKLSDNINGMAFSTRKLIEEIIKKDKRVLFENILMQFKGFDTTLPEWIDANESVNLCKHFGIEITVDKMIKEFRTLNLLDDGYNGPALNNVRECSINAVYLLIITKLWK